MKQILVLGAGRSSSWLIKYLLSHATDENWTVIVGDLTIESAEKKIGNHPQGRGIAVNLEDTKAILELIQSCDAVISMLPPALHGSVALICLEACVSLFTASYVSEEMRSLHEEAKRKNLLFLNEMGLDPGIDHLSALKIIHELKAKGAHITEFSSYCGGLMAPSSDNNPWHYKFTWNPMNVVTAGQATAVFMRNGQVAYLPPSRIFSDIEYIDLGADGSYEAYANRDSLSYIEPYGLQDTPRVLRGTLRGENYCKAWNVIAALGITDNQATLDPKRIGTYKNLIQAYLPKKCLTLSDFGRLILGDAFSEKIESMLNWLELESDQLIPLNVKTPAQALLERLQVKWALDATDCDRIVMYHRIRFQEGHEEKQIESTLITDGSDQVYTAMAKTVGLPLAIAVRMYLKGLIPQRGVCLPVYPEIYLPVLEELALYGIHFNERETTLND